MVTYRMNAINWIKAILGESAWDEGSQSSCSGWQISVDRVCSRFAQRFFFSAGSSVTAMSNMTFSSDSGLFVFGVAPDKRLSPGYRGFLIPEFQNFITTPTSPLSERVKRGQVGWDKPLNRTHRAVNIGPEPYEEITIFYCRHSLSLTEFCIILP